MFVRLLIITIGLGAFVANGFAQDTAGCPTVSVTGPSGLVRLGDIARYAVQIKPIDDTSALTYKWSVSKGVIKAGQGTSQIEVIQSDSCFTATVEITGLPSPCPAISSETACVDPAPMAEKLVEISGILTSKNVASIKEAIDKNHNNPHVQFFFIISGTNQKNSRNRKLASLKLLFKSEPDRATYITSEKKDDKIILWAVPPGATPPKS